MCKKDLKVVSGSDYNFFGKELEMTISRVNIRNLDTFGKSSKIPWLTAKIIAETARIDPNQFRRYFKTAKPGLHILIKILAVIAPTVDESLNLLGLAGHEIRYSEYDNYEEYREIVNHPEYTLKQKNELLKKCVHVGADWAICNDYVEN